MKHLLQQVVINDPRSSFNGSRQDILIQDGKIAAIGQQLAADDAELIRIDGLQVSPGWVDPFAHFNDPGAEHKETLESGAAAAAAGGFTQVFVIPNTKPAIDAKTQVEYVMAKADRLSVRIHPLGALTKNTEGKELAEMYDMKASGAIAFTDGLKPVQSAGLLVKALQYVKAFGGLVIQVPDDTSLAPQGLMNEGIVSTRLGLPGKPMMAEELMVARDIKLARYTGSRLHFTAVSSAKSLEYIRRAKEGGIDITCSVTPYHLYYCEEDLLQYDTNLKVNPPLRTAADRAALRKALADGLIDAIATHHQPHDYDAKILEFEYAKFGMIGLESAFGVVQQAVPELNQEQLVRLFSINARNIFGLPAAVIETGVTADLTLYLPQASYTFTEKDIRSKCANSPFIGHTLSGKVVGTILGTKLSLNL
ncbi:dihydroorotase [Flavihumibacter sp. CACIAM 22H1]|uniref:dihydroorotase n=1 Tax=Flavihumibacter sp. CACIAM 22H1 TaxID=1812911 RepID=UPI0007A8692F|nr:dihydroorotase [Flavihumibacter sp. CACIAM 22H1]KYP15942.1 MAG: dihydroorotase [Flavihumibacter sp. CACIAM 22H1]